MSLTSDDVKRVAKLARLGLTDVETTEILRPLEFHSNWLIKCNKLTPMVLRPSPIL